MNGDIFTKRFIELRHQHELTQVELAKKLGVRQSTLCAWEQGHEASYDYLIAIANLFDVTTDYLLGRTEI